MKITLWFVNGAQQTVEGNSVKVIHHKPFNRNEVCMIALVDNRESWDNVCLVYASDEILESRHNP